MSLANLQLIRSFWKHQVPFDCPLDLARGFGRNSRSLHSAVYSHRNGQLRDDNLQLGARQFHSVGTREKLTANGAAASRWDDLIQRARGIKR